MMSEKMQKIMKSIGIALLLIFIFVLTSGILAKYLSAQSELVDKPTTTQTQTHIKDSIEAVESKMSMIEEKQHLEREVAVLKPPEVIKLIELANHFHNDPHANWDKLIAIGDIYRKGAYPRFLPNEELASECYKVVASCPDGKQAGVAQTKYIESRTEVIANDDKRGVSLPKEYGENAIEFAKQTIMTSSYSLFTKPVNPNSQTHNLWNAPLSNHQDWFPADDAALTTFMDILENNIHAETPTQVDTQVDAQAHAYKSDAQNVHDHSVIRTMKKNIEVLKKEQKFIKVNVKEDVLNAVLQQDNLSEEEKYNAIKVIDKLASSNHSSFGASEEDILKLVWGKILSVKDTSQKENLKEMLGRQLASGVEHGHVVCSTGKITRMLGTFDGVLTTTDDSLQQTRPIWAVKEEIANMAAKTRKMHLESLSPSDKVAYENGYDIGRIDADMKATFTKDVHDEYVNKLGMSRAVIDPIVDMYLAGF